MTLFPELGPDEVLTETRNRWDLSGPLPTPKPGWLVCPICGHDKIQGRYWRFHQRSGRPTIPYRCDVSVKCVSCAAVWTHGVALDAETWQRTSHKIGRTIHWRQARQLLDG